MGVRRIERWHVLEVIAIALGAALWLLLVPNDDPDGQARNAAYWWLAGLAAVVLGALTATNESAIVGASVGAPALVLAGWTAPRGDGDGLWVLWFPLLFGLMIGLAAAGSVGSWLYAVATRHRRT